MSKIKVECATCHKTMELTDTSSLYRPDGKMYRFYCADCYNKTKQANKEKDTQNE